MNPNFHRRRRRHSFSSVRAIFRPLMPLRSEERTHGSPRPTDSFAVRALPRSINTPVALATASRLLALQASPGEEAATAVGRKAGSAGDACGVEEACGSFEKYLMEMVVEERKVGDLMDVEELLYCWGQLRCPVFVELVGRFYAELCMDLFHERETNNSADGSYKD